MAGYIRDHCSVGGHSVPAGLLEPGAARQRRGRDSQHHPGRPVRSYRKNEGVIRRLRQGGPRPDSQCAPERVPVYGVRHPEGCGGERRIRAGKDTGRQRSLHCRGGLPRRTGKHISQGVPADPADGRRGPDHHQGQKAHRAVH